MIPGTLSLVAALPCRISGLFSRLLPSPLARSSPILINGRCVVGCCLACPPPRGVTPTTPALGWDWNATAVAAPEKAHYNSHHHALGPLSSPTMSPTMSFATLRYWQKLMAFKKKHRELPAAAANGPGTGPGPHPRYSVAAGAREALGKLSASARSELPEAILAFQGAVEVTSATAKGDEVYFPTPLREQEATAAIKGLEACAAAAISKLRYGTDSRTIQIDSDKVSAFLMSAYLTTLDGMDKPDPRIKSRIPGK